VEDHVAVSIAHDVPAPTSDRRHRRVLGLRAGETDPVRIILAAQILLRRWRRAVVPVAIARVEVGRIVAARDALLEGVYGLRVSQRPSSPPIRATPAGSVGRAIPPPAPPHGLP